MSTVWLICGAGRGVGKTTLAQKLCEVLPAGIYAKCGHCKAKANRPENFFTNLDELKSFITTHRRSGKKEHIVVESNALARLGQGDITVFIDGIIGKTCFRKDTDQLRKVADLKVCSGATAVEWKKILRGRLDSKRLCDAVCDCLAAQQRYLFGSGAEVRTKVWLEATGLHVFGTGLGRLLANVERFGTLQDAAKEAKMSYRHALNLVTIAEEHLGKTLIDRHAGGRGGGRSTLSAQGRHILNVFQQLNEDVNNFADRRFAALCRKEKLDA